MKKTTNKRFEELPEGEFKTLVQIVCKHYSADPEFVLGGNHQHSSTTPRNIIATLWSRAATLRETSELVGWKSAQQVCHARSRVAAISERPSHAYRLKAILEEVTEKIPFLTAEIEN
jgi:hypothetical protein